MEYFDVVIVGAGPAGLRCAEILGNSNLRVLILERKKEIGPKVCAGGLTAKDMEYLGIPKELIDFSYKRIKFDVSGYKSEVIDDKNIVLTVDRKNLGEWLSTKVPKMVKTSCIVCTSC